ncbi:hypothetical protein SNE40_000647 [Patella caerulea]|uniref:F-box domain-containing protein n=1 Tax=Patella caerulea TaxID=87958 RepID=A0AAN8KLS5_PATCE
MEDRENGRSIKEFPDNILLNIFSHLSIKDLTHVAVVCKTWHRVSLDDFLWRDIFQRDWKIKKSITIAPGKLYWKNEYKRLVYHTPARESQNIQHHKDQVLHVSFSHNGLLFATCSKDGTFKVWTSDHPCKLQFQYDMKEFHWKYTQFSQFNMSDSLLLVSGVHFGESSTSGEIAVFSIHDNFELQCRMINKPYDVFGTWYNDTHLLSGSLYWTGDLNSCSALWLNMASQAIETEDESVVMRLFKFHNQNASSIRTIMIANCYSEQQRFFLKQRKIMFQHVNECSMCKAKYYLSTAPSCMNDSMDSEDFNRLNENTNQRDLCREESKLLVEPHDADNEPLIDVIKTMLNGTIEYKNEYRQAVERMNENHSSRELDGQKIKTDTANEIKKTVRIDNDLDIEIDECSCSSKKMMMENQSTADCDKFNLSDTQLFDSDHYLCDKLLIFTLGSEAYTPHQIGIKRIPALGTAKKMKDSRGNRILPSVSDNNQGLDRTYDKADHTFEMGGHIIGMCLSPDQRFLYVNCRPWPRNYRIEKPLEPPPLAQEIDIHVIDLERMIEVGTMLKSHKAYTANDECFFIFLDVSDEYVSSGAEDKHGYIWDRHYGICLNKFQHNDVVNSVAFNPIDPEMLVSVSDDNFIKVWRSRNWFHQQKNVQSATSNSLSAQNSFKDISQKLDPIDNDSLEMSD